MRCTYVPYAHQTSDWILAADPLLRHTGTSHIEYRRINDVVTFVQEGRKNYSLTFNKVHLRSVDIKVQN